MRSAPRRMRSERGQTLILFVGLITVVFVMAAAVIDVGLWLAERRAVQRAADLAAAAGAQDLLVNDGDAVTAALDWADRNGFENGADGVTVSADLLCYNTTGAPPSAICTGTGSASACSPGQHCDSLRVTISKPSTMLFSSLFGVSAFDIEARSSAGLTVESVPTDTVILMDATGSMAAGCSSQDDPTCPMQIGQDAGNIVVGMLLGGLNTASQVGYAAYNYCYASPFGSPRDDECIKNSNIMNPTANTGALHSAINTTVARGGTNLCVGLEKALDLFSASNQPGAARKLIVLSDGEGGLSYPVATYPSAACNPVPPAMTSPPAPPPGNIASGCNTTASNEADLEAKTNQRAQALKDQGVEIYVVSLLRCTPNNGQSASPSYCAGLGTVGASDSVADQRLLKCIASSPAHYVYITSASQIPEAFREIAAAIVSRGLLE